MGVQAVGEQPAVRSGHTSMGERRQAGQEKEGGADEAMAGGQSSADRRTMAIGGWGLVVLQLSAVSVRPVEEDGSWSEDLGTGPGGYRGQRRATE